MNFHQSIFQNNDLKIIKYLALITLIFLLSFKANTEIPEKYKIESSLPKCKGTDYKKWTYCYGEYKFPRIEYKGEWINGNFHGKGILKEVWGDIFVGDFVKNKAEGYGKQTMIQNGEIQGYFEGELKNDLLNGKGVWVNEHGKFEGNYKDHLLDGFGKAEYSNGTKYEGYWKKDFYHG